MAVYPDRGAGNDPKLLFFSFFLGGSLSPPRPNIFAVGNMEVMICLGQGGLRTLSASSYQYLYHRDHAITTDTINDTILCLCRSKCFHHQHNDHKSEAIVFIAIVT